MPIQEFRDPYFRGVGGEVGRGLGQTLGSGIENLAKLKLGQVQQRHQQNQLTQGLSSLGIPKEQASQIALLPPELQNVVVKNYLQGAETVGLNQALGGLQEPQGAQQQNFSELTGTPQAQQPVIQEKRKSFEEILKNPRLKPEHRIKIAEMQQRKELAEQKLSAAERKNIAQETKAEYDKIVSAEQASKNSDQRMARMERLINKGSLPIAALHNTFKEMSEHGVGGEVPILGGAFKAITRLVGGLGRSIQKGITSRDTEEFEKLSADFIKDAKNIFGNRLTDTDVTLFLETVPSLAQTDNGKRAVIRNMKLMNDASHVKYKVMKDIIAANRGKRPANLAFLVEEQSKPELDALAEQFKQGI